MANVKNPKTGKWVLSALRASPSTYLGGLTLPAVTSRPHMGPFNRVTPYSISPQDEIYRQHDLGYGKLAARGKNPYTSWNSYDQQLLDAPTTGWPDFIAKGAFMAKKFLTYGLPDTKNTSVKSVYSKSTPSKASTSAKYVVTQGTGLRAKLEGMGSAPPTDDPARKWAQGKGGTQFTRHDFSGKPVSGGKSKLRVKSRIKYQ